MAWTWTGLLIRSGLVLLAAEALRRFPRRTDAAYRHRMLLAAFALLLLWPVFQAVLPVVQFSIWPHSAGRDAVTAETISLVAGRDTAVHPSVNWPVFLWLTGVCLALAPLVIGHVNLLRLVRRGRPIDDERWNNLCDEICIAIGLAQRPELLTTAEAIVPLSCGLRRPRIVLPRQCLQWSAAKCHAVLLHELAHIKRRDIPAQVLASLVTALWWFQPFCWFARWNLRRESERACDAVVVDAGLRASDYASDLLEIAQGLRNVTRWSPSATAMARCGDLEARLCAILEPPAKRTARKLWLGALCVLTTFTISASAISFVPDSRNVSKGVSIMKPAWFSGIFASASLSAATIAGSVFNPSGGAVADAKATLSNADTHDVQETATSSEGRFAFEGVPAGEYVLRIERPGFATLFREFDVQTGSNVERALVLTPVPEKESAATPPLNLDPNIAENNLIRKVQPVYPASAKANHVQGRVELEVVLSVEGVPVDIRVLSSPDDALTQSALEAVRQWRYRPALWNGNPIEVVTQVTVNYTLSH
jgi:TonB family protein